MTAEQLELLEGPLGLLALCGEHCRAARRVINYENEAAWRKRGDALQALLDEWRAMETEIERLRRADLLRNHQ